MKQYHNPMSLAGLAEHIGIPRQRIYNLVKRGLIHPKTIDGTMVISPEEIALVVDAVVHVRTKHGVRIRFNWV